jgi:hypothetical protein
MWIDIVLRSVVIILIWVALWGLVELAIDALSNDKTEIRTLLYFALLIFGAVCLYILEEPRINI